MPLPSPDHQAHDHDQRIVVVAADNTLCHVYESFTELLDEPRHYDTLDGGVEFFDVTGRRLTPVFSPHWQLTGLQPTVEPAEPEVLRVRFKAVMAHLDRFVRDRPEVLGDHRVDLEQVLAALPHCDDPDLVDVVDSLPRHIRGHRGNLLHNAVHAAGWAHR
ncbi:hypothetical protein [Micromonospora sp. SH-82]|uniref:hypothetical protein n=1 Tax=Micromonospora sp. SH-82 TaxID=3132938 RepID=UPI003EBD065A